MRNIIIYVMLLCLVGLAATEQNKQSDVITLSGNLISENEVWQLRTATETIRLELAPQDYLSGQDVKLEPAAELTVTGFLQEGIFVVTHLKFNDYEVTLRADDGTPLWASAKPANPHYVVDASRCIGCRLCVNNCPVDAIEFKNGKAIIDSEKCINCGICKDGNRSNYRGCPVGAIHPDESQQKK